MKITVEIPENELQEICRITGISKKGPALRKLIADGLRLKQRAEITGKFMSGEWGAELADYETSKQSDREKSQTFSEIWRD